MAVEKKIEALEGEFKLLKGEVKQTLTDVRDFLTALKLPAAEDEEAKLFGMEGGGVVAEGKPPMEINLNTSPSSQAPPNHPAGAPAAVYDDRGTSPRKVAEPSTVRTEYVAEVPPSSESPEDDEASLPSDETADERVAVEVNGAKMTRAEVSRPAPQVNMLANLVRWVALARREIGNEQLPTFLDVYSFSENLPPELREIILGLAEVTTAPSDEASAADVWSQLLLQLHGVLSGGGSPPRLIKPLGRQADQAPEATGEAEASQTALEPAPPDKPRPITLKLVLPTEGGAEQEFSLNLAPQRNDGGPARNQPAPDGTTGKAEVKRRGKRNS